MTTEIFAETLSVINVRNGVVRMVLVDQSSSDLAKGQTSEDGGFVPSEKAIITMPVGGFLYMASVFQNLLSDEKFGETVRRMVEAGLVNAELSDADGDDDEGDDSDD